EFRRVLFRSHHILYLVFHILLFQTIFLSIHSDVGCRENNVGYLDQAKLAPFLDSLMLFLHVVKASNQFADLDIAYPQQVLESIKFYWVYYNLMNLSTFFLY